MRGIGEASPRDSLSCTLMGERRQSRGVCVKNFQRTGNTEAQGLDRASQALRGRDRGAHRSSEAGGAGRGRGS